MSDSLKEEGFAASDVIAHLGSVFSGLSANERKAQIAKSKAVFQLQIKNAGGKEQSWIIDLKKEGTVTKGEAPEGVKPDVTLIMNDDAFVDIASGKLGGQKAYMTGKLKTRGNMMLATKLEGILKLGQTKQKAKL